MFPIATKNFQDVDLFRDFSTEELDLFLSHCDSVSLQENDTLFRAGDDSRALYLLVRGAIRIDLEQTGSLNTTVAELQPAAVFGESNFFHPAPHHTTAVCTQGADLLRLTRERYDELRAQHLPLACKLTTNAAEILAARLQQTDRWVAEWLRQTEAGRVHEQWVSFRQSLGAGLTKPRSFIAVGGPFALG